ncbi:MAG: 1,4-dihydroxy-2-naphthoate octaprenyltransferase [Candidatus Heimdallarchaeaceae archaeon]
MLDKIKSIITKEESLLLSSSSYSNTNIHRFSYIYDENSPLKIYIAGRENTISIQHMTYNPDVMLDIGNGEEEILYNGRAVKVIDHPKKKEMIEELSKKDSLSPQGIYEIELFEISPINVELAKTKEKIEFPENKPKRIKEILRSIKTSMKMWMRAMRFPFLIASISTVLVGGGVAFYEQVQFNWINFVLTIIGITFVHAGIDLLNDYFDHLSGTDDINKKDNPFSGGSQMIQEKLFSPERFFLGGIFSLSIAAGLGLYLNFVVTGNIILYLGLAGFAIGFFYVGAPIKYAYRSLGEIGLFLGFGPIPVFGAYYVQAERFSWLPLYASIPVGLFIMWILFINEFPDYEADKAVGKNNWVVLFGKKWSSYIYIIGITLTYIVHITFVIFGIFPLLSLVALLALPLIIKAILITLKYYDNYLAMIPASAATVLNSSVYSVLLALSFFLSRFI